MIKVISCAGFGNTGSSIVTDYFSEFSSINIVGGSAFEFFLLHENDGIRDLEFALTEGNRLKTDLAIKRFLKLINNLNFHNPSGPNYKEYFNGHFLEYTYEYLESLNIIKWTKGWWHRSYENEPEKKILTLIKREKFNALSKKAEYKLYESNYSWKPSFINYSEEYYCHVSRVFFVKQTKKYLEKLFLEIAGDNEYILFDQLFPTNINQDYLDYFDFAKVIIVDRDPRDLYFMNKVFWGSGYIPSENVDIFIKWFRETRTNICNNQNVLFIKFEDMIFDTSNTQQKLADFIGIDISQHDKPETHLIIAKSITNTQVFNRYVIDDEEYNEKIHDELSVIEKELSEYIYDFPELEMKELIRQEIPVECIFDKCRELSFFDYFYLIPVFLKKVLRLVKRIIKRVLFIK